MNHKSILFVYSHWQSFVREDYHLLSDGYKVEKLQFFLNKKVKSFIKGQLNGIFQLLKKVPKHDISYIWFCDYHAFWAVLISKLLNKKSIIVVGGFDAVKIPSIDYGLFIDNGLRVKMAKWAYKNCDRIIAVDASLINGENNYAGPDAKSGISHFVSDIEHKIMVIPTGYDPTKWKIAEKKQQVLTVALIKDKKVFLRKGIDVFLEVAKYLPSVPFVLVGLQDENLIPKHLQNIPNVTIYPILPQDELIQLYAETKVYAQFSMSEGLPNVLCEAMMSGCVPVGSSANGIPLAIGEVGYVLKEKDTQQATQLIQKALKADNKKSLEARNRIIKLFPKEGRKKALVEMIASL